MAIGNDESPGRIPTWTINIQKIFFHTSHSEKIYNEFLTEFLIYSVYKEYINLQNKFEFDDK